MDARIAETPEAEFGPGFRFQTMESNLKTGWPSYLANLRRHWIEHLLHLGVGGFAGALLVSDAPWAGAVIMATVWVRQSLEFQKRRDTPGIDLSYHLAGLIAGVFLKVALTALGLTLQS